MTWPPRSDFAPDEVGDSSLPMWSSPCLSTTPPWLLSLVDLVSLLLTFMILVYAFSRLDGQGWSDAASAIRTAFGGPSWMTPEPLPQPTMEAPSERPAIDLGYLALLVEARLGDARGAGWTRLETGRLRIVPASDDGPGGWLTGRRGGAKQLRQLGAILANVGNAVVVEVGLPTDPVAGDGPSATAWEAALTQGADVAALLTRLGVAPARLAVFVTTKTATAASPTATAALPTPPVRIAIVVQRHGGSP